ncbi:MAG: ISC system 2Fe-2S type ferredoxin [Gammaproteobacteria bacterium]
MTVVQILPHPTLCPEGAEIEIRAEESLLDAALRAQINIEHACEMSCACTTCHVLVRKGFASLPPASDDEEDLLDKAWGLEPVSRLGCQVYPSDEPLVIEIPKYTINQVSERH